MTEWILIIFFGVYTLSPKDNVTLIQTGSNVEFRTFVDNRSCEAAKRLVEANKNMRNAECLEITKKAD